LEGTQELHVYLLEFKLQLRIILNAYLKLIVTKSL